MPATRADVARLAGVSPSTVTYVLTGKRATSELTRERVLRAVEQLGYHPNSHASVLAARSVRSVGVLFRMQPRAIDVDDSGYVGGLRARLETEGIRVFTPLVRARDTREDLRALVHSRMLDAAVLMDVTPGDERERFLRDEVPVVLIGTSGAAGGDGVDADFEQMVDLAVSHLTALGHRRVLYLARRTTRDLANVYRAQSRAMSGVARARGVEVLRRPVEDNAIAGAAMLRDGRLGDGCTAVVSSNPVALEGLLAAAWSYGVDVPGDLSVVALGLAVPRDPGGALVTEVCVDRAAVGRRAGELLLRRLAEPRAAPERLTMGAALIDRGSVAAPGPAAAISDGNRPRR
ncbi:LacI family DNA-binding transcriptional regulator [Actinomyces gerencseriae]|uniref:LacI family DNA-binding transcriptional regulator n=1 Tax=Actinomyces gerencseriae TaxID=52769 RepID=UPI0023EF75E9|nr:LacI family DNA-binding transcriptional regulator [Actinomyces gerencseriae]